jgi:hypothetical protein
MARRSTPERLHHARREATVARLIGEGELPERAQALVVAWEAQAARDDDAADGRYWEAGWTWIEGQRARRAS